MKKSMTAKKLIGLGLFVSAMMLLFAAPAFAADINSVSIAGLGTALSASDEVPPPRMFTEGIDFGEDPDKEVVDIDGRRVYLDFRRQAVFLDSGNFYRFDSTGALVPVGADEDTTEFIPAYEFPSDGNEYFFGDATAPANLAQLRGRGPHGGYTTTSAKCATCHSAHSSPSVNANAAEGTKAGSTIGGVNLANAQNQGFLTRAGSTSCEFCHLTGTVIGAAGMSSNIVYHGGIGDGMSYYGDTTQNPDDFSGHRLLHPGVTIPQSEMVNGSGEVTLTNGLTCSTCHAVHGNVGTWQPEEFFRGVANSSFEAAGQFENDETVTDFSYKMLRANPGAVANPGVPAPATEMDDPSNPWAKDPNQLNQFTLSVWCASCHNSPSLDKQMVSIRSAVLDGVDEDFDFADMMSRVTTFTAQSAEVHDVTGNYAEGYPVGANSPDAQHPTTFWGVYSGPGGCYTCHRGDLGGPLTATWETNSAGVTSIVPIPDEDNPPLTGVDPVTGNESLERFRALGYFSLDTSADDATQLAEQARNLACSSCHFGTADYARWAPQSDWPHRSGAYDVNLLGADRDESVDNGSLDTNLFCARCHFSVEDETNRFVISHHYVEHRDAINNEDSEGVAGPDASPGFPPSGAGAGNSVEGTSGVSNETTTP